MAERKRRPAEKGPSRSRSERPWKDATNPTAKPETSVGEPPRAVGDATDLRALEDQEPAPSRAQAGRQDQAMSWQTGPGSGGATQSAGRVKEHEARSGQARPKK
jgi:hypothetical protein